MKKIFLLLIIVLSNTLVFSEEFIENYLIDIDISDNHFVKIHEEIKVNLDSGKRGIYRTIPLTEGTWIKGYIQHPFKLSGLEKDNDSNVTFKKSFSNDSIKFTIGDKNIFLEKGFHTYKLDYEIGRIIQERNGKEILFLNLIGLDSVFPIKSYNIKLNIPEYISIEKINIEIMTGKAGEKKDNFIIKRNNKTIIINQKNPLEKNEGLSLKITAPYGTFLKLNENIKDSYIFQDKAAIIYSVYGTIIVLLYYIIIWYLKGKDPKSNNISVKKELPKGISASVAKYIIEMEFSNEILTTAILSLISKGYIQVKKENNKEIFYKNENNLDIPLEQEEEIVLTNLFKDINKFIPGKASKSISDAIESLKETLKQKYNNKMFKNNTIYTIFGVILSFITTLMTSQSLLDKFKGILLTISITVISIILFLIIKSTIKTIKKNFSSGISIMNNFFIILISIIITGVDFLLIYFIGFYTHIISFISLIILLGINIFFNLILKQPTEKGQEIRTFLEGLKKYFIDKDISIDKMNKEEVIKHFEEFLPYAYALNIGINWCEKLNHKLTPDDQKTSFDTYRPKFYYLYYNGVIKPENFMTGINITINNNFSNSNSSGNSGGTGGGVGGGGVGSW